MANKCIIAAFFITLTVITLILAAFPLVLGQNGTNVKGLLTLDTVWIKAGSPYNVTAPLAVNDDVTLTIQPGVTVNLNGFYIRVNGTLTAVGNAAEKITFNGGQVTFTTACKPWSEHTQSGCIIQYAVIDQTQISALNPVKIDSCMINSAITVASSIVTNNVVNGNINSQSATPSLGQSSAIFDSSVISNNNVKGNIVLGTVSLGAISAAYENCTVSYNIVEGSIISGSPQGAPQIFNNTVSGGGISCTGYGLIFTNYVHNCQTGISLSSMRVFGGYLSCYATAQNNIVVDNTNGISIHLASLGDYPGERVPTVQNNTVARNTVGLSLSLMNYNPPIIQFNNLEENSNYNFYLVASNNVNASYNWWGTTDKAVIAHSIYDFNEDFNLGTVNFEPILTSPNANSVIPSQPTPTPSPNSMTTSTPTPTVPEFPATIALAITLTAILAATLFYKNRKSKSRSSDELL